MLLHLGFDGGLEGVEVLDVLVGEDLLEEVFVEFGLLVADGVVDDDVEVGGGGSVLAQDLGGFFFGAEHLGEVDDELRAHFLVDELLALRLVLDLAHVEVDAVFLEAAFHFLAVLGFADLDLEAVVFAHGLRMAGVGVALLQVFHDLVHLFVGGDDMVEVDHGVGEVDVDFGTQGGFEVEVEVVVLLKVGRLLLGVVERIAEEVELVVDDMLVERVGDDGVQGFHLGAGAIHLLNHAHRHHAGTESGDIGPLSQLSQ